LTKSLKCAILPCSFTTPPFANRRRRILVCFLIIYFMIRKKTGKNSQYFLLVGYRLEALSDEERKVLVMGNNATARAIAGLINDLTDKKLLDLTASENRPLLKAFLRNPQMILANYVKSLLQLTTPLIPRGYEVVEDVPQTIMSVKDLVDVEFISHLKNGELYVSGGEMKKRAIGLNANFGHADGVFMLMHEELIPKELQGKYIVLTGTVVRSPTRERLFAYLYWDGEGWVLSWCGIGFNFPDYYVLPRRKSS